MKITKNFCLEEFFCGREVFNISPAAEYMVESLCNDILEPLREFWSGKKIKIVSGIRSIDDYNRLLNSGYNPSETSDHYYGEPIKLTSERKIERYGNMYGYSVGAVDFVVNSPGGTVGAFNQAKQFFQKEYSMINLPSGPIKIGQMILETAATTWIHISNHPSIIYSASFCKKFLPRLPFLISTNSGKTYAEV